MSVNSTPVFGFKINGPFFDQKIIYGWNEGKMTVITYAHDTCEEINSHPFTEEQFYDLHNPLKNAFSVEELAFDKIREIMRPNFLDNFVPAVKP